MSMRDDTESVIALAVTKALYTKEQKIIERIAPMFDSVNDLILAVDNIRSMSIEDILAVYYPEKQAEELEKLERQAYFQNRIFQCSYCGGNYNWGEGVWVGEPYNRKHTCAVHPECLPKLIEKYEADYLNECVLCGCKFYGNHALNVNLCENCATPYNKKENGRLYQQLYRARKSNVEASLTLREWLETIADFGNRCAYCESRAFGVMEHFIPVERGGGTSKNNIIPSCQQCNSIKGYKLLSEMTGNTLRNCTRVALYLVNRA